MPMRREISLLVLLVTVVAVPAGAGSTKGGIEPWRSVETDMRQAGCFAPPVATVRDALRSADTLCRFRAARVLGLRGEKEAIPDLKALHEGDPDPGVRQQATIELVRLGESGYLNVAREAMEQAPTLNDKVWRAGDLADVGDPSGVQYLEEACRSADLQERRSCAWVIGRFSKVAAQDTRTLGVLVDLILALAEDSDVGVRQDAVFTLAAYGIGMPLPETAIAQLAELAASSPDPKVQQVAQSVAADQTRKRHDPRKREP